jgi:hypothetical protein
VRDRAHRPWLSDLAVLAACTAVALVIALKRFSWTPKDAPAYIGA